jgi:alcohol dehydrogenase YqhD (iron-dependent ADH family)
MTVTKDNEFVQLVETTWGIHEDDDATVAKQQIEDLTKAFRSKLRTITNNSLEEYVLMGIFKDFDTNRSGSLTLDELQSLLSKL